MDDSIPAAPQPRVPPVEPELLGSAIFLFSEYLERIAAEAAVTEEDEEDEDASPINMREVLDLFAEELGTGVTVTLNLYMRTSALFRLLAASPSLARLASDGGEGHALSETALLAAARLDLHVTRSGDTGFVEFDPREFRSALTRD